MFYLLWLITAFAAVGVGYYFAIRLERKNRT